MSNQIYAHLDSDNICEAITEYQTTLNSPPSHYKEIDTNDPTLIGKSGTAHLGKKLANGRFRSPRKRVCGAV